MAMIPRLALPGALNWKLGLIPILVTVLFKLTGTSQPEVDTAQTTAPDDSESAPPAAATRRATVLPELSLVDALRFDPFAALPLLERPAEEPLAVFEAPEAEIAAPAAPAASMGPIVNPLVERAATLKQLKVSAVFPSAKGAVAIIDSKTVRAGDFLSPGVRVVEIRGMNVILRVENGESAPSTIPGEAATR